MYTNTLEVDFRHAELPYGITRTCHAIDFAAARVFVSEETLRLPESSIGISASVPASR